MTDGITDIVQRLMLAPNGGAIVGAVFDICREFELPEPNRGHLAGVVKRYGQTENGRRRIWVALAECYGEHVATRDTGGLGNTVQYMERVIAMSGVAPAARRGAKRSPDVDDAVLGLQELGLPAKEAIAGVDSVNTGDETATELVQLALQARGAPKKERTA